jgi:hypothetical protein
MQDITLKVDDDLLRKVYQYADERETTLEAVLLEYMTVLADRAGRRLTLREETYVDYRPTEEVLEALRREGFPKRKKL